MVVTAVTQHLTQGATAAPSSIPSTEGSSTMSYHASYGDTSSQAARGRAQERNENVDVIVQLKLNLAQLEELHARMHFLMGEIGYLLKANDGF